MEKKKTSWEYQRNRYQQLSIKFFIEDECDCLLFHHLSQFDNKTKYIKQLIRDDMWRRAYSDD